MDPQLVTSRDPNGRRSVSHFERLLEKFEWLFRRAASAGGKVGVAHAVGAYWAKSSQASA